MMDSRQVNNRTTWSSIPAARAPQQRPRHGMSAGAGTWLRQPQALTVSPRFFSSSLSSATFSSAIQDVSAMARPISAQGARSSSVGRRQWRRRRDTHP